MKKLHWTDSEFDRTYFLLTARRYTFALRDSRDSNMCSSSELSISNSIPVILPAMSGYMLWISGNRRSPSICFCSCGGASANMLAVSGSWPCMCRAVGGAICQQYSNVYPLTTICQSPHLLLLPLIYSSLHTYFRIIIIITDLYSAFRSKDTEALDAAQED